MPFNPLYMTESKVTIGGTAYEAEVSGVRLTPTSSTATWKGLKAGSSFTKGGLATWAAGINFGQDHELAASLSTFLFEHEGEEFPFTIEPIDGGTGFSGTLIAQAGEIGGDVDTFATATVTLPVQGKPTRTPAA
jgi:hypothetical protein